ncbi:hypothetical protein [Methylovulum psychrotolerans]|uniref:Uncharacterized protein n=1 Tax=Methylovulum psychrotolerans TaxID=1704499 RepID=A0A1Z4C0C9_9GAMM|nr:hypothetical protein [Methylovulum psychrotolerans]ASF47004.1 hypothetical protein CEK71_13500 [Methylovulum psychrotolerans]
MTFVPEEIKLNPGDLAGQDMQFFDVGGCAVVYIDEGKNGVSGAIALSGRTRTFPLDAVYSYDSLELDKAGFLRLFPDTKTYFTEEKKLAA